MRYELEATTDAHGRVVEVSWAVRDHEGDLSALGMAQLSHERVFSLLDAFEVALDGAQRNLEINGGVQAAFDF